MPFQFRKEAIEEDLNSNFPSQGQGNPPLYYSLSEVVVPTYSINQVTEGSGLPENLQTAWDFATGHTSTSNTTSTIITTTGFWKVDLAVTLNQPAGASEAKVFLDSGITTKVIWEINTQGTGTSSQYGVNQDQFVVFLRSGDSLKASTSNADVKLDTVYRQIADINGNLVNPLGFSFA